MDNWYDQNENQDHKNENGNAMYSGRSAANNKSPGTERVKNRTRGCW